MNKKDLSRYFSPSRLARVPLYKAILAVCCAVILVVGTGAGIAVTAANAGANSASQPGSASLAATAAPTLSPTASPTPEPTATPAPVQLALEATAVQQSLGITVMDAETGAPVLGEDFEVTLKYTAPKKSSSKASSSSGASSAKPQKEITTYNIDPKTGTVLIKEVAVGDYTITVTEREGYVMPGPATASVTEKVTYKADTEAVKDKIKTESEVGAGDIVNDNKVIDDQTSSGFDPTKDQPTKNDYDYNDSKTEPVNANVYLLNNTNFIQQNGKWYLRSADGSRSNYYVAEADQKTDVNGNKFAVKATLDKAAPASVGGVMGFSLTACSSPRPMPTRTRAALPLPAMWRAPCPPPRFPPRSPQPSPRRCRPPSLRLSPRRSPRLSLPRPPPLPRRRAPRRPRRLRRIPPPSRTPCSCTTRRRGRLWRKAGLC